MISDDDLYRLAVFLGVIAMLLIVVYHWLEINAVETPLMDQKVTKSSRPSERDASVQVEQ